MLSEAARLTVTGAPRAGTVSLLVGDPVGANFRFDAASPLAADPAGNFYGVSLDDQRIRKLAPAGVVSRPLSSLRDVIGLAVDRSGNLLVSSYPGVLYSVTPAGEVTTRSTTGVAMIGLSVDAAGNVCGIVNNLVRKVAPDGAITLLAGAVDSPGDADGIGPAARFNLPLATAVDAAGNVYVSDYTNNSIRRISPQGQVGTLVPASAGLQRPTGIALDPSGDLLVADSYNHVIRKVAPSGAVSILAGAPDQEGRADGTASSARFGRPGPLAVDGAGNLCVGQSDYLPGVPLPEGNGEIRRVDPAGNVTTVFRPQAPTPIFGPYLAADAVGNVLVQRDTPPYRSTPPGWHIERIAADGTAAQVGSRGYSNALGLVVDATGHIDVADGRYALGSCSGYAPRVDSSAIDMLSGAGERLRRIEGALPVDDPPLNRQVRFSRIASVAADDAGSVYLSEDRPDGSILKVAPDGTLSTLVANVQALDLAVDRMGNVHASICLDPDGPDGPAPAATQIVRYSPQGAATVLAGSAGAIGSADGPGAQASFGPGVDGACARNGIALDAAGNVYVSDPGNDKVRKVSTTGFVSTVVGQMGTDHIVLGALPAGLSAPTDVAFDPAGNLYVGSEHAILKVRFDD